MRPKSGYSYTLTVFVVNSCTDRASFTYNALDNVRVVHNQKSACLASLGSFRIKEISLRGGKKRPNCRVERLWIPVDRLWGCRSNHSRLSEVVRHGTYDARNVGFREYRYHELRKVLTSTIRTNNIYQALYQIIRSSVSRHKQPEPNIAFQTISRPSKPELGYPLHPPSTAP